MTPHINHTVIAAADAAAKTTYRNAYNAWADASAATDALLARKAKDPAAAAALSDVWNLTIALYKTRIALYVTTCATHAALKASR